MLDGILNGIGLVILLGAIGFSFVRAVKGVVAEREKLDAAEFAK